MTGEFVTDGHLGGYVAGGDPDSDCTTMWQWLVLGEGIRSVLDVGCGDGAAMRAFRKLGCAVVGVDGMPQDDPAIMRHDFTRGPLWHVGPGFDLVWSCEFVEHVDAAHIDSVMGALTLAPLALITHGLPGQPGWHHVNCQPPSYWIDQFAARGYQLDQHLTDATRELAAMGTPGNYYARTGLAFRRQT